MITLHYFNARGRAQFLRYYLACRDHAFEDHRIGLSADFHEWREIRDDRSVTGPFKRLPVLEIRTEQVSEALVIANTLHERLGDAASLSPPENLRHAMLLSSLYTDLLTPLASMIWADRMYPGVDLAAYLKISLHRLRSYLSVLDESLTAWEWLRKMGQRELMVADCLLWEELDRLRTVLEHGVALEDFETLARFYDGCPGRNVFSSYLEAHPCALTGHPDEPAALENIRKIVGSISAEEKA